MTKLCPHTNSNLFVEPLETKSCRQNYFWSGLVMIKPSCLIGLCSNNKSSHSSPLYLLNDYLILVWINNLEKIVFPHKHYGFVNITTDCHTHTKIRGVLQRSVQCRVPQGWMRAPFCHGKHLSLHSHTPLLPKYHVQPRSADPESPGALSSWCKQASSG